MNFNVNVVKVERYGTEVYEHTEMDALRKTQCLCLNCNKLGNCVYAEKGLELCKEAGMAWAVTRCAYFEDKI